jgi:diketogulonate reductase-like aldo/keto reductase
VSALSASGAANTLVAAHPHYLIYGTAWKKERTAQLVNQAVNAGFRFIDTACQPKHYNEAGVGDGWSSAAQELNLERSDFWIQTKFTSLSGQDPTNLPYDKAAPIDEQIRTSLRVSLKNLHTTYLDSWVMHGPEATVEKTVQAWRVMEEAVDAGQVKQLGISNQYNYQDFVSLYQQAKHKPRVLQNRFYGESNWDTELRTFCREHDVTYQSFWTLTANRDALNTPNVKARAAEHGLTTQTYMFAFLMSLGPPSGYFTPLSGTTSPQHMAEDVAIMERVQRGERFFETEDELQEMAQLLGMPAL